MASLSVIFFMSGITVRPVERFYEVVDVLINVVDDRSEAVFVGFAIEIERPSEELASTVGDGELDWRCGVTFYLVEGGEDVSFGVFVVLLADGIGHDGVFVGELVAVFEGEVLLAGGEREVGEVNLAVEGGVGDVCPSV